MTENQNETDEAKEKSNFKHELIAGLLAATAAVLAQKLAMKGYDALIVNRPAKAEAIEVTATEAE